MRFRKYSEPFIRGCFGDLIFLRKEKYDPQKDTATYPCIELENIEQETCLLNGYFDSKKQKSIKTKFQSGDVLFGKLRPYLRKYALVDFNGVCSTEIWALYSNKLLNSYLFYYIQTEQFLEVANTSSGTKMPRAEWNLISSKEFRYPQSREEMGCVSHFLSKIDQRIETQSKIINCLESLLNEISHHYFGSLSSAEIALSKIADIYQPKTISQSECSENGTYNVFGANGIIGKFNQYNHDLPQICITCRGSTSGNVFMTESYSWITGNAMVINIDKNLEIVNKTFLYYYLSSMSFKNIISGSGQPQIVREPLMKIKIKLPSLEEQLRFEKIISSFASKLQKEKDILALYKKQKAYLLANMFI